MQSGTPPDPCPVAARYGRYNGEVTRGLLIRLGIACPALATYGLSQPIPPAVWAENLTLEEICRLLDAAGEFGRLATWSVWCAEVAQPAWLAVYPHDPTPAQALQAARALHTSPCDRHVFVRAARAWRAAKNAASVSSTVEASYAALAAAAAAAYACAQADELYDTSAPALLLAGDSTPTEAQQTTEVEVAEAAFMAGAEFCMDARYLLGRA